MNNSNGIQIMTGNDIRDLLHNLPEDERSRILNEEIGKLPLEKRAELVAKQLPAGLSVILGGNNTVNSTFTLQINSSSEELSKLLKNLPPDTLAELIRAVSRAIANQVRNPAPGSGE